MKKFNFKVGDIIVCEGIGIDREADRLQEIISFRDWGHRCRTKFLDNGYLNEFNVNSPYADCCKLSDKQFISEYKNGIPVLWEDEV